MVFVTSTVHEWHRGPVKGLAHAGSVIASGGGDGVVRMVTVAGDHVATYQHHDIVNAVAVAADGATVSGSRDRTVRLWEPASQRAYEVGQHDHWVMTVAWSPDDRFIVSGSEDRSLAIWDPENAGVKRIEVGYPVNGVDWRGDTIAAVTGDRRLLLLAPDGTVTREIEGATQMLWGVALSPDATTVAWVGRDRRLWLAPVDGEPQAFPAHTAQIWSVAWDSDGDTLITAAADGLVKRWSREGQPLEAVRLNTWARRAIMVGGALYVAAEDGKVHAFADNAAPADPVSPVVVPDPPEACSHWDPKFEHTSKRRCEECGSSEEPRLCVTCGHVGCCESQLAHGTKHWLETGHPNTMPAADGPLRWRWCYEDDIYVKRTA